MGDLGAMHLVCLFASVNKENNARGTWLDSGPVSCAYCNLSLLSFPILLFTGLSEKWFSSNGSREALPTCWDDFVMSLD